MNSPLDGPPQEGRALYQGLRCLNAVTNGASGDVPWQTEGFVLCVTLQTPAQDAVEPCSHWKALSLLFGYLLCVP